MIEKGMGVGGMIERWTENMIGLLLPELIQVSFFLRTVITQFLDKKNPPIFFSLHHRHAPLVDVDAELVADGDLSRGGLLEPVQVRHLQLCVGQGDGLAVQLDGALQVPLLDLW